MSAIRDLNTLPLPRASIDKLKECGFQNVGELKGSQPLDLAREMDVEIDVANDIVQAVRRLASGGATYITGTPEGNASAVSGGKAGSGERINTVIAPMSVLNKVLTSATVPMAEESKQGSESFVSEITVTDLNEFRKGQNISNNSNKPMTARDMAIKAEKNNHIITFCKQADRLLGGGIPLGHISDIVGPPGIGKTQLAMQLALDVQIPEAFGGVSGQCVYVDTEGSFQPTRALSMASALSNHLHRICKMKIKPKIIKKHGQTHEQAEAAAITAVQETQRKRSAACQNLNENTLLDGIRVYRTHDQTDLLAVIGQLDKYVSSHSNTSKPVKLVVVDSIAFHFRQDIREKDVSTRAATLGNLGQKLNKLAFEHNLSVLTTNHCLSAGQGRGRGSEKIDVQVDVAARPIAPPAAVVLAAQSVLPTTNTAPSGTTGDRSSEIVTAGTICTRYDSAANSAIVPALGHTWAQAVGTC